MAAALPTVLIVPGLREHADAHWQTLLERELMAQGRDVRTVSPMGRTDLDCARRVVAIENAARAVAGPLVLVAHSAGCVMVAHWARLTRCAVRGALLAAPPDFERPMPEGYPTLDELRANLWLAVPRQRLPFHSIVAASRNDPLAAYGRVAELAEDWGGQLIDLGAAGHLNPASGFGRWTDAELLVDELSYC